LLRITLAKVSQFQFSFGEKLRFWLQSVEFGFLTSTKTSADIQWQAYAYY